MSKRQGAMTTRSFIFDFAALWSEGMLAISIDALFDESDIIGTVFALATVPDRGRLWGGSSGRDWEDTGGRHGMENGVNMTVHAGRDGEALTEILVGGTRCWNVVIQ